MGKNKEHAEIGKLVKEVISDTRQSTELGIKFDIASEDAKKILSEAKATVEKRKTKEETTRTS